MSGMKRLEEEVALMYWEGYTILAIARSLKLSTKQVQSVVNLYKGELL